MTRLITASEVIAIGSCYEEGVIRANHGDKGLTFDQLVDLDIPHNDLMWVLVRLVPEDKRGLCAADFAETVLHLFEEYCPDNTAPRQAIELARDPEATSEQRRRAAHAAAYAADAAARAAAYAADAADAAAAREKQQQINIEICRKYIEPEETS